jgi:hypothetical protein
MSEKGMFGDGFEPRREGHSQLVLTKNGLTVRDPHPPKPTVFDEARAIIAQWEKEEPAAMRIVLVCDGQKDIYMDHTGVTVRQSDLAGLCFAAAIMATE